MNLPKIRWNRVARGLVAPGLRPLRGAPPSRILKDVFVGVSVACVAVPAGLAMGELAGLPPVAGVYATLLPLAAYALFGSSRHLVVGPEGVLAALTLGIVAPLAGGDTGRYVALAAALVLMVGSIHLLASLLRLGFMADFLSRPVLLGFVNGTAISRGYARTFGYPVGADRELAGLGAANLAAGFTQAFPVGSSGSRTALNASLGGATRLVGVVAAVVVGLVAAVAMPLVAPLPKAALAVVILLACLSLVDVRGFGELARVSPVETALAMVSLFAVLLLGVLNGVGVAVLLSIGVFVYRAVRPHDAVLGTSEDIDGYRDITTGERDTHEGLIVYRFDAPLFFPNAPYFAARVHGLVEQARARGEEVRWFMVNMEAVTHLDSTAVDTLRDLRAELAEEGVELSLARAKAPVRETLRRTGLAGDIGEERLFWSVRSGVRALGLRPPRSEDPEAP
ncbi:MULTISPECIES: SulP family inorganic anion transporter [unclassified Nocardiopsis]|uniref:SulP family inorganic anion transporter n=1 Tax=Nocardiopsis TaxID=2013 RepID=UPI00387B7FF9